MPNEQSSKTSVADSPPPAPSSIHVPAPSASKKKRSPLFKLVIIVLVVLGGIWLLNFIHRALVFVETDDSYIDGHVHQVSSRVAGSVTEVFVKENETVKSGQVLARIDSLEFDIALQKENAALAQARAQYAQMQAQEASAEARVQQIEAQLQVANVNAGRDQRLFQGDARAVSKADVDTTRSTAQATTAALTGAKSDVAAAQSQVEIAKTRIDAENAAVSDVQRQLSYVEIKAPADGRIGNKNIEVGNRVQVGEALFAVVENDYWVTANFKETQLKKMQAGQEVEITVDAIGSHIFKGKLDSISPASGAQFALLPPDNATGNFTKVVQRVPVKIIFDPDSIHGFEDRLRPGLSTVVSVRIK